MLQRLGSRGLYLEALPDDPAVVKDPAVLKENRRRLKFYRFSLLILNGISKGIK